MFAVSNSSNMLGLLAPPQSGLGPAGPGLQRAQILGIPEANLLYKYVNLTSTLAFNSSTHAVGPRSRLPAASRTSSTTCSSL